MSLLARVLRKRGVMHQLLRSTAHAGETFRVSSPQLPEDHSIHKRVLHLYDLFPSQTDHTYIAPNASVVGEVYIEQFTNIWDRAVIRGDLNAVRLCNYTSIKENVCISNVSSLPTGQPSFTYVGPYTTIEAGCTLVSCEIGTQCIIGARSVILEGAKVEDEAMVGPNSVVPPGRLIPSHQLWAGNPVRYVRDLTKAEIWTIKVLATQSFAAATAMKFSQTSQSTAHLLKENKAEEEIGKNQYRNPGSLHEYSPKNSDCPEKMVLIPPMQYARIKNPVCIDKDGQPQKTKFGQVKVKLNDTEIRTHSNYPDWFPLYPEEKIEGIYNAIVANATQNIRIRVTQEYVEDGKTYFPQDLLLIKGPISYYPRKEQEVLGIQKALEINSLKVIKLKALKNLVDDEGIKRIAGQEWLYRKKGNYLPSSAYIVFVADIEAKIMGEFKALHLNAKSEFTDFYGKKRKAGDNWLVGKELSMIHFVDAYEDFIAEIEMTIVEDREFCVVNNPFQTQEDGTRVQKFGGRKLIVGPTSFFLQPYEELEDGHPHAIYVLKEDEALLLFAENEFKDTEGVVHYPGEKWLFKGPGEYIPPIDVKIIEKRAAIPLHENEGIYIRNEKTGEIRAQIGSTYMLKAHESLWQKELPDEYEQLLQKERLGIGYMPSRVESSGKIVYDEVLNVGPRDKTKVISYRIPTGKCVQVYNYKSKENKIVFGPELILLQPDEILTLLSLSGGKPKRENCIQSLSLLLGPEIISDLVEVETADHAKIELDLSYKWHFEYNREQPDLEENKKLFSVGDFVGDVSKSISSRIRGVVSSISYEDFHHNSAEIIRGAVFGKEADGTIKAQRRLNANNLVITSCDIKSQRPIEKEIEEKLKKNTFLAIQIKTKATEMEYSHQTLFLQQESKGELDIKKLEDETLAETARIDLYRIRTEKDAMFSIATALADAKAENEKLQILGKNKVDLAVLDKEDQEIFTTTNNILSAAKHEIEASYEKNISAIEINEQVQNADVEVSKLRRMIGALGSDTLAKIVNAGPEMKARMLQSLGLKGYLMTDGKSPINLFDTANGLVSQAQGPSGMQMGGGLF